MSDNIIRSAEIIRSKRKTAALQIAEDGHLIVRVPLRCPEKEITAFIEKNRQWIETHTAMVMQTLPKIIFCSLRP